MEQLPLEGLVKDGLGYEVVAIEGKEKVEVMLRLTAPDPPEGAEGPFHTQIVLDTSESMHPRKLFPALRGIDYLASHLNKDDRIGIVTFGGTAEMALPGGLVWEGEEVRETLRQIRPFGIADPLGGLLMGLREAKRNAGPGEGQIILITDARLFVRDHEIAHRLAGIAKAAKESGFPVTVISMDGKGSGFLSGVAKAGGGRMCGTNEGQRVCEVMLEKVPGERNDRIRGVELVVEPCENVRSIEISDEVPVEGYDDGVIGQVGDLRDGETRDLLIKFEVDDLEELDDDHLAGLTIKWSDLVREKAFWASMPVKVNGYPGDPRPRVRELFNTDPEEGVMFEFPRSEIDRKQWPGRPSRSEGDDDESPRPPQGAQERMRAARERRERVDRMAEGDLPPEMEARIAELAREQSSQEVARLMEEIREQVPAQLLAELKAKVEEQFRDQGDDEEGEEDDGPGVIE
ncbi:MAG: VWA domain-containing protein [Solirubrobacterales bacterium]